MIGFMANNVLPFRLGEFVRPWVLARREKLSKTTLLATVVVERAVDMLTLLGILGVALARPPVARRHRGRAHGAGRRRTAAGPEPRAHRVRGRDRASAAPGARVHRRGARRFLPGASRGRVARALEHFIEGLGLFRDLRRLGWVLLLSFVMFLVISRRRSRSACGRSAFASPWYGGLMMLVITAIGIMVPAAPGYIGTLNLACVAGLALFHVGKRPGGAVLVVLLRQPVAADHRGRAVLPESRGAVAALAR